jgi:ABC-type branched-subunit amino acid transport system substrate-binding protein
VGIETDASDAGHNAGLHSLDFGDMKGMAQAVADDVNRRGGLYGRKLVPVYYDASTARAVSDPAQVAQEACTKWTQDRPVATIVLTTPVLVTDDLLACAARHDTPVSAHSTVTFTEADYRRYRPYLTLTDNISHDRLVRPWVSRLSALGYFGGWDSAAGKAGAAPVRVGIVYQSTPAADHGTALLVAALRARHVEVPDVLTTSGITDTASIQGAIVRFRRDGVTHVFLDFAASVTFPTAAEQQRYRPRYAVNSQDEIAAFLEANSPPAQLHGALGVGWMPPSDVDSDQDPHASPGAAACAALMRKAGVALTPRQAYYQAMVTCDLELLFAVAAGRGGGFDTSSLASGVAAAAGSFPYATTFGGRSGLSSGPDKAGVMRDIGYVDACRCFRYLSERNQRV